MECCFTTGPIYDDVKFIKAVFAAKTLLFSSDAIVSGLSLEECLAVFLRDVHFG